MLGLIASALGRARGATIADLAALRFIVRVDRPGVRLTDFHTIGGGLPAKATVPTASGGRRGGGEGTIVSRRQYLADAAFTVAVEGPTSLLETVMGALQEPAWAPYLGRRACPPSEVLVIVPIADDPAPMLRTLVPLARARPRDGQAGVTVQFVEDLAPNGYVAVKATTELWDVPQSFARFGRRYDRRAIQITTETLPAELCAGHGTGYLSALHAFAVALDTGGTA
jgi:CRISPR system Cascade subunit CasD